MYMKLQKFDAKSATTERAVSASSVLCKGTRGFFEAVSIGTQCMPQYFIMMIETTDRVLRPHVHLFVQIPGHGEHHSARRLID